MIDSYTKAGVNIQKAENTLSALRGLIKSTHNTSVISGENSFASLYRINEKQILAAATDGVGTKLDLAIEMKQHRGVGIDLVAMVVNDLAVYGIQPLFFLDYVATAELEPLVFSEVVEGIVEGCRKANCALIGGETAEMPGFYPPGKYDLAGFAVGLIEEKDLITGENIKSGDIIMGLASSGLHSNGFSLVRKIIKDSNLSLSQDFNGRNLGQILLEPTVIYAKVVGALLKAVEIKGLAHITGGGFTNINRILPLETKAVIERDSWEKPAVFDLFREKGSMDEAEMFNIFNMGIGMVAIVNEKQVGKLKEVALESKISSYRIGRVEKGNQELIIE